MKKLINTTKQNIKHYTSREIHLTNIHLYTNTNTSRTETEKPQTIIYQSIMKICAACHTDLPKESYSKKQWKLDIFQRRCKVCTAGNQEVQQPIPKHDNKDPPGTKAIIKYLDSKCMEYAGKKINDGELFKQPPPLEDCPICFLLMPSLASGWRYQTCCGKVICSGCIHAPVYDDQGNEVDNEKCPFCRTPWPESDEEAIEREKMRVETGDPIAINNLGVYYRDGRHGYPQDYTKALELWYRAGELGYAAGYNSIGFAYNNGEGVEVDRKKALYYYEQAAMAGNGVARYNLGIFEETRSNMNRALKHYTIAVRSGHADSLSRIKDLYSKYGRATKEDYMKALQSYQTYLGEIKSVKRDEAAATADADEDYRYY